MRSFNAAIRKLEADCDMWNTWKHQLLDLMPEGAPASVGEIEIDAEDCAELGIQDKPRLVQCEEFDVSARHDVLRTSRLEPLRFRRQLHNSAKKMVIMRTQPRFLKWCPVPTANFLAKTFESLVKPSPDGLFAGQHTLDEPGIVVSRMPLSLLI
ncbi:hypothetical protein [uncultured Roseibium sp.]|uniref:hypothetical protein n=1 Tax=uncultured Roseibium sp. TaxID=1936171 RepID=UPI0026299686|nr:hypothetical protein [uncultured Roseibium sp.]